MTKHKLLKYLYEREWTTPYDIAREFNLSHSAIFSRFEALRANGVVTRRRFRTDAGTLNYYYSLTSKGLNKLYYFDELGCKRPECPCAREG